MSKFRVTLSKYTPDHRNPNPFHVKDCFSPNIRGTTTRRIWEFEAKNEREVRRLYAEAVEQGLSQVVGFELEKIEVLP